MKGPKRGLRPEDPHGICVIDKPSGWTSHDVVARLRSVLDTPRVGHAGTLDPMATGVLVIGVGRATRLLRFITDGTKRYEAEITFGTETDSLDAEGVVTARHDMAGLSAHEVVSAAAGLTGDIMQIPPMVSAIKVDGKRLHQLAREGKEIDRQPRPVHVERFDVEPTDDPLVWTAVVECSAGTYVRSLAADLGSAIGGGAHLSALRRTHVGPYGLDEATSITEPVVLPVLEALRTLDRTVVSDTVADRVRQGAVFAVADLVVDGDGPWAVLGPEGDPLAVYERFGDTRLKPSMVLAPLVAG